MSKTILVTGGAGYVGSHCVLEFLQHNYNVIVVDNLVNAVKLENQEMPESLIRVERLANKKLEKYLTGDLKDQQFIDEIFANNHIDIVVHFAALKSVGESVAKPLEYYENNVSGTINLLKSMRKSKVTKLIFSSSATVYGDPEVLPLVETLPTGQTCTNPYGRSKHMVEVVLKDLCKSSPEWSVMSLRYFNPVGAHSSGDIGEDPQEIPNNLMPFVTQVAVGMRPELKIFGGDYNTPDGTGVRDYIHIEDLSNGHLKALEQITTELWKDFHPINLGTGRGYSVLEVISTFESANGVKIPYKIVDRRPGDVTELYADAKLANEKLGWTATRDMYDMCASAWKWQSKNPKGYKRD
ncbi:UDP-glucose 4-epimerase-like [Oppia nitens]|uniref:UDP-glucose 4-epimerase-like n=1 Tax=Oppia nitens TaxID=1686743 RepID=UPI0023DAE3A8|nr:UDP-glucose 4-epimerase-like [Oppia nitens]